MVKIVSSFQYSASAIIVVLKLQDNEYKSSFLVYQSCRKIKKVVFDVKKYSSSAVLILVPRMLEMAFPSF